MITWLPVVGYEGFYEVSDQGDVRSLDRLVRVGADSRRLSPGKILKGTAVKGGYLTVQLCKKGSVSRRYIHQLVLEAFIGPRPTGLDSCHNDGDCTNNGVTNLRWDTRSENALDRVKHGTHYQKIKTLCPRSHPYDETNTRFGRNGARWYRQCDRDRKSRLR